MSGEIEAAGDIATGGLLARAVEPAAGERRGARHSICLNCTTPLAGEFCHACGQSAHVHRTLGSIGHDLLHGVFHFEGKVWRTIPMLVRHPGRLTRCYIDGHRARYVSPLALFLFAVFVMAAAFSWLGGGSRHETAQSPQSRAAAVQEIDRQIVAVQAQQRELAARPADGTPSQARSIEGSALSFNLRALELQRGRAATGRSGDDALNGEHTGVGWLDPVIDRVRENPRLLVYKIQSSSYKFSWALIPISTPFVALLFLWGRRFPMYDHAIFVTYSLSFMTLFGALLRVLSVIGVSGNLTGLLFAIVPPVHMFAQLRGTYGIGRFSAAWRTVMLVVFASIALAFFGTLIALLEIWEA